MQVTRAADYAVRGVLYLASAGSRVTFIKDISKGTMVPEKYLAKILQGLTKAGILRSARGVGGGFSLGRSPKEITLWEVVEAVDGPLWLTPCLERPGECGMQDECPTTDVWDRVRKDIISVLTGINFQDLLKAQSIKRQNGNPAKKAGGAMKKAGRQA
ncbi:MAG: Rrf2 family transcriptional regulator [Armatimonadetes bacterium]|nr:Rrf2 family transcriptional regulator [Armatimonadota bacterium]